MPDGGGADWGEDGSSFIDERGRGVLPAGEGVVTADDRDRTEGGAIDSLFRRAKGPTCSGSRAIGSDPASSAVDRRPGRFLLTGAANFLLMQRVSESLAGRAVYLHLGPLTEAEKAGEQFPGVWSALLSADTAEHAVVALRASPKARRHWTEAAAEGGYPPILGLSSENRSRWFDGYIATYLERDLQQLAHVTSLSDFRRLLEISALRLGALLNGGIVVSRHCREVATAAPHSAGRERKNPKMPFTRGVGALGAAAGGGGLCPWSPRNVTSPSRIS